MGDQRHELGLLGEQAAERFLRRLGLRTLARRFNTPAGELDLVMRAGETVVFVEVKTQTDAQRLDPEERVGSQKRTRLIRAAHWFIHQHQLEDQPARFDVVSVLLAPGAQPEVQHFADAFTPRGGQ